MPVPVQVYVLTGMYAVPHLIYIPKKIPVEDAGIDMDRGREMKLCTIRNMLS